MRLPTMLWLWVVAMLLASVAGPAWADELVLKNGARYEGILKDVGPDAIVIQSDGADWTFHRDKVASFHRNRRTAARERRRARAEEAAQAEGQGNRPILVYSPSWSRDCNAVRSYMRAHRIAFVDRDIDRVEAREELAQKLNDNHLDLGGGHFLEVHGRLIPGCDTWTLRRLLARHGHHHTHG